MINSSTRALCRAAAFAVLVLASTVSLADLARPVVAERIDLIRHGESEDNPVKGQPVARLDGTLGASRGKILSGWNSASLTMLGVSQAVRAGEALQQQEKNASTKLRDSLWIYSPLLRTRQTLTAVLVGARLSDAAGLKVRPDTRLFERSAGEVTNLTWDEAAQIWPEMKKGRSASVFSSVNASYPNGESLEMVYRRASAAIDEAIASERRVIVVSHELTIKALVAHLTSGSIDDKAFAFAVENAKPITLVRRDGKWEITASQP
jgi:broad specificity phosphatase PhoE